MDLKNKKLRLVKVVATEDGYDDKRPFKPDDLVLFLGEIANMPGHVAVVTHKDGRVHFGYHPENFREATEEEV